MEQVVRPPLRAVVFDWGGTLTPWATVDLEEPWRLFAREIHGVALDSDAVSAGDLARAEAVAQQIRDVEEAAWQRGREEHSSANLADILQAAGLDPDHDRHHLALAAYHGFWEPHTVTDPQVRPLWESLRERGLLVGVLSNTIWPRSYHEGLFQRDGVAELIDADAYSSELSVVKPHAEAFQAICDKLQVSPQEAVYVGDRLYEDIYGPQQVGMRAILVPHSNIPPVQQVAVAVTPDGVAHQLLDVLALVAPWS